MAIDGRDKTVYTHNQPNDVFTLCHKYTNQQIPTIKPEDSYKYLGIWVNLRLDWTKQIAVTNKNFYIHMGYLARKCFTATQTIEIINLIVYPAITYHMGVITFPKEYLKKWENKVTATVAAKLKCNKQLGYKNWSLPRYQGGFNLSLLKELQITNSAAVVLNFSLNAIDKHSNILANTSLNSDPIRDINSSLEELRLRIAPNPAHSIPHYEHLPEHYLPENTAQCLSKAGHKIDKLISPSGRLHHIFSNKTNIPKWGKHHQTIASTHICTPKTDNILPHIKIECSNTKLWDQIPPKATNKNTMLLKHL